MTEENRQLETMPPAESFISSEHEIDAHPPVEKKYVAFCDILGFSNRVASNFDETLSLYQRLSRVVDDWQKEYGGSITMYSDSILVHDTELSPVLQTVQNLSFFCLQNDFLIRGGIAYGNYWEEQRSSHLFVVSDALINAVKLERSVSVPAVVIADDIEIPESLWASRFMYGPFGTSVLHFRDRNIVNPFSIMWGASAASRASRLMEASPAHRNKYLWFLALYDALRNDKLLVPEHVHRSFTEQGFFKSEGADAKS